MNQPTQTKTAAPHVCSHQAAFFLDNWLRRLVQPPRKILAPYVRPGDTVIDLGCGPGHFTLEMARMASPGGKVAAVDLQPEMLAHVRRKAEKQGLMDRIILHQCAADRIGLDLKADFILAYYMVHETPNPAAFLAEVNGLLKPGGRFLIVEPKLHVSKAVFDTQLGAAVAQGFRPVDYPKGRVGRGVLLENTSAPPMQGEP